jgi:hypothetical protein
VEEEMSEGLRSVLLWIVMPICIYIFIPLSAGLCTLLTPQFLHDSPKRAIWVICALTLVAFLVAQGSEGEKAITALVVFGLALWWHFSKYFLLFQLTHDPILRFFLSDADKLKDDLAENFNVNPGRGSK